MRDDLPPANEATPRRSVGRPAKPRSELIPDTPENVAEGQ